MKETLLVVQPSDDYARRILKTTPNAVFVANNQRAKELKHHPRVIAVDLNNPTETHQTVAAWSHKHNIKFAGITTFICEAMRETAALAQALHLPFHADTLVRRTRDKHKSNIAWQREQVPTPITQKVKDLNDLLDFTAQTDGPYILKPSEGSGSAWVLRVENADGLSDAHTRITTGIKQSSYLIQQCVLGREFSADLFVERGNVHILRLTEKYLLPIQGRAGLVGAYYPANVTQTMHETMRTTFLRGVMALGVKSGIVMADGIWMRGKLYLLEMALRPGGDCLPDLCILATGYNPIHTACEVALGKPPQLPNINHPKPVAALHLMTHQSGPIQNINFDRLKKHPVVLQVEPYHLKGDTLRSWEGSYDDSILASCIVHCANPNDLPVLVEMLTKRIDIQIKLVTQHKAKMKQRT